MLDVNAEKVQPEIVAHGVRNSVGFDWDPVSKKMWFTDNNRDNMGDDILNRLALEWNVDLLPGNLNTVMS